MSFSAGPKIVSRFHLPNAVSAWLRSPVQSRLDWPCTTHVMGLFDYDKVFRSSSSCFGLWRVTFLGANLAQPILGGVSTTCGNSCITVDSQRLPRLDSASSALALWFSPLWGPELVAVWDVAGAWGLHAGSSSTSMSSGDLGDDFCFVWLCTS